MKKILLLLALFTYSFKAYGVYIVRDSEVEHVIKKIAYPLFDAANINIDNIKVFIVHDNTINAYIINNKNIFIHSGLLQFSQSPNTVIGVIAHEIGHISQQHILYKKKDVRKTVINTSLGYALGMIAAITINPNIGQAIMSSTSTINYRMFLANNREQEEIADQCALKYLDIAGYDYDGLVSLFRYFHNLGSQHGIMDQYLLTHPLSKQRLENIQNYRRKNTSNNWHSEDTQNFKRIIDKVHAFFAPLNTFKDEKYLSLYTRSIINYRKSNIKESLEQLNSLIKQNPYDPYFYELKAQIFYKVGNIKKAIENYKIALQFLPDDLLIKLELVQALLLSNAKEAVHHLEQVLYKEKDNPFIWKQLAIAYGKLNNVGMSYFAFTNKFFIENDTKNFYKYANLSKNYLPKDSVYISHIDDMKKHIKRNL
ncbi:M48 family metalloprotease [Candidatus Neoehrlichia procyonis]|uniref:Peptidase M48 family protein n=1 Tax=Candidatus Neoehrlichia procyonis str. RAC413 TaxID=1359163 RepID=A0A0F3NMY3_9RICK|nr:M48 family metalloprotease [Candidatus Neoehrlichia lotoris]KJV69116.1 peptidase M48 family protein [Candidatus Neoehrlichia lotoris str. RAC413]